MFPGKCSKEKIELYRMALMDLDLETIRQNAAIHIKRENFFPSVAELRNEPDPEAEAQEAFKQVEDALNKYYDPNFHGTTLELIKKRVGGRLFNLVKRYGTEIFYRDNITTTRAQFLKAYKAESKNAERKMLRGGEPQQIGEIAKGMLSDK